MACESTSCGIEYHEKGYVASYVSVSDVILDVVRRVMWIGM